MKNTNKILLVLLLILLCAFAATKIFRSPALESNLDTSKFRLDTASVSSMVFHLRKAGEIEIALERNDSGWTVQQGAKTAAARTYEMDNLLRTISNLKPERIVSRNQEKWDQYEVGDSASIKLVAYGRNGDKLAEWFIGEESQGLTYVRDAEEPDIYALEGNLRNRFSRDFNSWRDRTFLKTTKALINKLTFDYQADSGFVLQKTGRDWMIGNRKADSTRVDSYLNKIQLKEPDTFHDEFSPASPPLVRLVIQGSKPEATVKAWKGKDGEWILTSNLQEGVYFKDSTLGDELFPTQEWFLEGNLAE